MTELWKGNESSIYVLEDVFFVFAALTCSCAIFWKKGANTQLSSEFYDCN